MGQSFNRQSIQDSAVNQNLSKEELQEIAGNQPWIYLLQKEIQWHQVQQKVDSAALLSPEITPAGWYMNPANTSQSVVQLIKNEFENNKDVELSSETLDSLVSEFIDLIKIRKSGQYLPKIIKVNNKVLGQVNNFLKSRGQRNPWNIEQYLKILNYNLNVASTPINKDSLPANDNISIEMFYGLMISHYGESILLECPQLAILLVSIPLTDGLRAFANKDFVFAPPKIRKLAHNQDAMLKKKNLPIPQDFYSKTFADTYELSEELKKIQNEIKEKQSGYSKKSLSRLRDLIHRLDTKVDKKQTLYDVRKQIVSEHLSFNEDYRLHSDKAWEIIFYEGLTQALNRLPTDIGVYNNATLRDPSKHLVTRFLLSQNPLLQSHIELTKFKSEKKLEYLAGIVKKARELGYFISDWQNKLARKWSKLRREVLQSIQKQNTLAKQETEQPDEEKKQQDDQVKKTCQMRVPPPLQYCLALDLNPEAHPFSFTYGRKQGYCVDFESSLTWYLNACNKNEKGYFYSLLENPNCHEKFQFLLEIPEEIRKQPQPFNSEKEKSYILKLDEWLVENKDKNGLNTIINLNKFIDDKIKTLPEYLQKNTTNSIAKKISVIALFDSIFSVYPPEEVYLDKTVLPQPVFVDVSEDEEKVGVYNALGKDVNFDSQLLGYWGPPRYGGKI